MCINFHWETDCTACIHEMKRRALQTSYPVIKLYVCGKIRIRKKIILLMITIIDDISILVSTMHTFSITKLNLQDTYDRNSVYTRRFDKYAYLIIHWKPRRIFLVRLYVLKTSSWYLRICSYTWTHIYTHKYIWM